VPVPRSGFVFATCQVGAEIAVKADVARQAADVVADAVDFAEKSPVPEASEADRDVFA